MQYLWVSIFGAVALTIVTGFAHQVRTLVDRNIWNCMGSWEMTRTDINTETQQQGVGVGGKEKTAKKSWLVILIVQQWKEIHQIF